MIVVLDTNVIVSGLLNGNGYPGKVVDLVLENRIRIAYDDRILGEYEDVLARKKLNINQQHAKAIINHLELTGKLIISEALDKDGFQDPFDIPFAEVFITSNAEALVTGNIRHFSILVEKGMKIYSPAQFIERYFPEQHE